MTENFVSSLYLLIQSSTCKKCIEHCLTALATLLHVYIYIYIYIYYSTPLTRVQITRKASTNTGFILERGLAGFPQFGKKMPH